MLRRLLSALTLAAAALAATPAVAAERPTLEISGATFRPYPIALSVPLASGDQAAPAGEIHEALTFDLEVSGLFEVVPQKAFLADPREPATADKIAWDRWSDVGAEGLVKTEVAAGPKGLTVTFRLYDVVTHRTELTATYEGRPADARRLAHRFADELVRHFTKEPGSFSTRMAFSKKVKGGKEVWVADWDGRNAVPVSERGGHAMLPAWSPDGGSLAYTFYKRSLNYPHGHPQVWRADLSKSRMKTLAASGDLNSSAAWSPDGTKIAFTRSDEGNPEIYVMNSDGSGLKRLSRSPGIDTTPSFSPDGKRIAFVSDRHGSPQIFVMDANGDNVQRLTRQGNYNQTPRWSPRGDEIAFTARDERLVFDIFVIKVETQEIRRITQDQGNNEQPTWSPNGRLLAFSSTRDGERAIYVSSADGNVQKRISPKGGTYSDPAWGPLTSK